MSLYNFTEDNTGICEKKDNIDRLIEVIKNIYQIILNILMIIQLLVVLQNLLYLSL